MEYYTGRSPLNDKLIPIEIIEVWSWFWLFIYTVVEFKMILPTKRLKKNQFNSSFRDVFMVDVTHFLEGCCCVKSVKIKPYRYIFPNMHTVCSQ